jgi:hypothetical protein
MRYWAIRNHGNIPDGLIRFEGVGTFAYVDRTGEWRERAECLMKVREWNVDPVDAGEAAAIANRRGRGVRRRSRCARRVPCP